MRSGWRGCGEGCRPARGSDAGVTSSSAKRGPDDHRGPLRGQGHAHHLQVRHVRTGGRSPCPMCTSLMGSFRKQDPRRLPARPLAGRALYVRAACRGPGGAGLAGAMPIYSDPSGTSGLHRRRGRRHAGARRLHPAGQDDPPTWSGEMSGKWPTRRGPARLAEMDPLGSSSGLSPGGSRGRLVSEAGLLRPDLSLPPRGLARRAARRRSKSAPA